MHFVEACLLAGALTVVLGNGALYAWRAWIDGAAGCDRSEQLGLLDAAGAFVRECFATAVVVLLFPLGWVLPRCRGRSGRGAVVLLPGWGLNRAALLCLQRRLRRGGWGPVCCVEWLHRRDIDSAARAVHEMVRALPQVPTTLIAFGGGGLVARYYLRRYPAPRIRRLVTLGTAHGGSEVARLGGRALRSFVPGSKLLRTLQAADRVPQQFDVIAIHSRYDALILPPHNAEYPGAFNVQVNDVGHFSLLFSRKIYRLLAENLDAPLA